MKTFLQFLFSLILTANLVSSEAQTSKLYLQVGGSYLLHDQIEQFGFDRQGPSVMGYAEVGMQYKPLSVGAQQTFLQEYSFYRFSIKQQLQTVYAKYSFNQYLNWLPYGLDPYAMVGASIITNRFQTYAEPNRNPQEITDQQVSMNPGYTFGIGLQAGSERLILGLHYQYTPSKEQFTLQDFEELPFSTSAHLITIDVGIRFTVADRNKRSKCPRFGRKGILRL
ncbi:MAG: hypothetical protein HKN87_16240 [Saprospiraceae bacterium]|nr:hypothetical protein [Saprospiraceae bacterium]